MSKKGVPQIHISRRATFSCAHRLNNAQWSALKNESEYGKCNRANYHGHNYVVTVTLKGPIDGDSGMVINLTVLKRAMAVIIDRLDHFNLDVDVPYFADNNVPSTAENVAVYFWDQLARNHPADIGPLLHKVHVQETENNSATYKGERV